MANLDDIISKIEELKVIELAELIKKMEEKFGISAVMPAAVAGAATGAEVEEKTFWKVLLKAGGSQKIQVIKVIREATNLGLKESKDLVEGAPKIVKEELKKEEAEELKKKLEGAGATVELQ